MLGVVIENPRQSSTNFSANFDSLKLRPGRALAFQYQVFNFLRVQPSKEILWVDVIETGDNIDITLVILSHHRIKHTHALADARDLAQVAPRELLAGAKDFMGRVTQDVFSQVWHGDEFRRAHHGQGQWVGLTDNIVIDAIKSGQAFSGQVVGHGAIYPAAVGQVRLRFAINIFGHQHDRGERRRVPRRMPVLRCEYTHSVR